MNPSKRRLGVSFSARTALIGLEIRQDSRVQSPCLTKKSAPIRHSASFKADSSVSPSQELEDNRVKLPEFASGIIQGKSPMDSGTKGISVQSPCVDLAVHLLKRGQGLRQALSGKDADFNLYHIQPGSMDGSVVDLQLLYDPLGLSRLESLIQRRN